MNTTKPTDQNDVASDGERRNQQRDQDLDWESKVVGRLGGRLKSMPPEVHSSADSIGWEASVLDTLRRRIERGPN